MTSHSQQHERTLAREDASVDLSSLREVAEERRAQWDAAGIGWEVIDGPSTDKPASSLILEGNTVLGQLTVWVSGEAEMDWGTPEDGGERHYDLDSRDALRACVADLEAEVGLR